MSPSPTPTANDAGDIEETLPAPPARTIEVFQEDVDDA